ncbi:MAG: hypothetical protein R2818_06275 [Flavobacteriales bacterium]
MLKRLIFTLSGTMLAVALMGSVVFTGLSLSRKLMGHWRVVMVYDADVSLAFPPFTIELDKYGRVIGRSGCGTFTGKWSTGSGRSVSRPWSHRAAIAGHSARSRRS